MEFVKTQFVSPSFLIDIEHVTEHVTEHITDHVTDQISRGEIGS